MGALYNDSGNRKEDTERVNRNPKRYKKIPVKWDGTQRGPELPSAYSWCDKTRQWWDMWRSSPQSMVMLDSDWEELLVAALIHHRIWNPAGRDGGQIMVNLASELRRRTEKYGATFADRLQMNMDITTPNDITDDEAQIELDAAEAVDYLTRLTETASKGHIGAVKTCMDKRLAPETARLEHIRLGVTEHPLSVHEVK